MQRITVNIRSGYMFLIVIVIMYNNYIITFVQETKLKESNIMKC